MVKIQQPSDYTTLETISVLALACIFFGLLIKSQILLYATPVLLVIGLFVKPIARKLAQGWLMFSHAIGFINTRIILFLIFFFWLTPIALIYRIFYKDLLKIKFDKLANTYWTDKEYLYTAKDLEKIW